MRQLAGVLFTSLTLSALLHAAAPPEDPYAPGTPDPVFTNIDAVYRTRFKGANLLKVERKEKFHNSVDNMIMLFPGKTEVVYKLTLSDPLNKKFDVVFASDTELVATEKYRTTCDALPPSVQSAIEKQVANAAGSQEPLEARLEKGIYKVSGKINGKKVNVETPYTDTAALLQSSPPPQLGRTPPPEVERKVVPPPEAPTRPGEKPEIAAQIDGPFRALFKDATILHIDHKETPNVTIHVFSVGGGSKYELTLSDPLNKKFKVVYTDSGRLYSATNFQMAFERLPEEVQSAIEKVTSVSDRNVLLDVRVDHKSLLPSDQGEYKVSGKINGTKISLDVPIRGQK